MLPYTNQKQIQESCFLMLDILIGLNSSLHWLISLSFCLFLYNGVCYNQLKLSISYVIVIQKGSNGDGKLHFFGRDLYCVKSVTL